MKIYIAHKDISVHNIKRLFILTRPFYIDNNWLFNSEIFKKYDLIQEKIQFELDINLADIVLIPFPINFYYNSKKEALLQEINLVCKEKNILAYSYITGDFGISYSEFSNIIYFRQGGFKSQLSNMNRGFPVALSDHFQLIFKQDKISPSIKKEIPIIGFCGHATFSSSKRIKETLKCILENTKRFIKNPFNTVYEPLFASAFQRAKLLTYLEKSNNIQTNIIYRNNYRAGATSIEERTNTTLEYYNNILESDYVLCVRGAGNFSVRFYETLMLGKIPVFINTDCLLPFDNNINWKNHVVWIEWKDRKNIAQVIADFHSNISANEFVHLQINNRKLWKETLSIKGMLEMISNDI